MRRLLIALAFVIAPLVPVINASPASAFCGPDEGCSPCGGQLVIQGKNTHFEFYSC